MTNSKQQILILDDLGIKKSELKKLAVAGGLNYTLKWDKQDVGSGKNTIGIITVKSPINKKILNKYPNLQFVAVAFTGYDSVDISACRLKNIAVYNVPAYSTDSVAELAIGLAISLLREIPLGDNSIKSGKWELEKPGLELSGRTIGIIGTGAIGVKTAALFKAFGCNLIGWSHSKNKKFTALGGKYAGNKNKLLKEVDIISVHLPLNKNTKNFITKNELSLMKKTAYIINTARGPIINKNHLIAALKNKKIAGAALDVFNHEPLPKNDPLRKLKNIILTPHLAYRTKEALRRRAEITINNIKNYINSNIKNRIDIL